MRPSLGILVVLSIFVLNTPGAAAQQLNLAVPDPQYCALQFTWP
jgi:hypothetical protein